MKFVQAFFFVALVGPYALSAHAADLSALKNCASEMMGSIKEIRVVSTRNYASDRVEIVLNGGSRNLVLKSEQSGGDMYDKISVAVLATKACWAEKDYSARGLKIDVVEMDGSLIVKDPRGF